MSQVETIQVEPEFEKSKPTLVLPDQKAFGKKRPIVNDDVVTPSPLKQSASISNTAGTTFFSPSTSFQESPNQNTQNHQNNTFQNHFPQQQPQQPQQQPNYSQPATPTNPSQFHQIPPQQQQQQQQSFGSPFQTPTQPSEYMLMQLQSQMLALSAMNSPDRRDNSRDNALLAYQMGEKLGALSKSDESYRETISRLEQEANQYKEKMDVTGKDLHATAKELEHQKEEQQRAHFELIRHKEQLQQLTTTTTEVRKELSFCMRQQTQTDAARAADRKSMLKAIDECQQKVAAATHKQAILDQTRERLEKDVARLTEQLESVRDTAAAVMQQQQLDSQAHKSNMTALRNEVRQATMAINAARENSRVELQQHEQRVQAQCAQQQRQIAALAADVRTLHASGSPVSGMSALLLALAMPFVSPERIVAMLGAVASGVKSLSAGKQLRRLWAIMLALDVSARYAAMRGVRFQTPQTLEPLMKTKKAQQAVRVATIARVTFELVTALQLALMLQEASSKAGRRATAAWQSRFGRNKPHEAAAAAAVPDLYADDNPSDDPTHDTSPPSGTSTKSRLSVLGLTAATGAAMAAGTFAFSNVKELPQRVWDLPSKAASYMPQQLFA